MPRVVTLLSDFGLRDEYAGVMESVIVRIAPDARVVHLTHGIEPQAVLQGALALAHALPYSPVGVHVAVVDPGVGSVRRAVVVETVDGRLLVGPDNGLLTFAAEEVGGIAAAHADLQPGAVPRARLAHLPRPRRVRPGRSAPRSRRRR